MLGGVNGIKWDTNCFHNAFCTEVLTECQLVLTMTTTLIIMKRGHLVLCSPLHLLLSVWFNWSNCFQKNDFPQTSQGGPTKFLGQLASCLKGFLFWTFYSQERVQLAMYRCGLMFSHQSLLSQGHMARRHPLEIVGLPVARGLEVLESALCLQSCFADGETERMKWHKTLTVM